MEKNYYEVLGVPRAATQDEIKKAFRQKSRVLHPDVNKDPDAEEQFKDLSEAYEALSSPSKKQAYDRGPSYPVTFGFSWDDILMGTSRVKQANADVIISVPFSPAETLKTTVKQVSFSRTVFCPPCNGTGGTTEPCKTCNGMGSFQHPNSNEHTTIFMTCAVCGGAGRVIAERCSTCGGNAATTENITKEITFPPGMNAAPLVISGEGHRRIRDLEPGNLVIKAHFDNLSQNYKIGEDGTLFMLFETDPVAFITGCKTSVQTPLGETVGISIKPNTNFLSNGGVSGKGLPTALGQTSKRANLILKMMPKLPEDISGKEQDLLRQYIESRCERGLLQVVATPKEKEGITEGGEANANAEV